MARNLTNHDIKDLEERHVYKYPKVCGEYLLVSVETFIGGKHVIGFLEYPEIASAQIYFSPDMFKEIMPPDSVIEDLKREFDDSDFIRQFG